LVQECEERSVMEYTSLVEGCDGALWFGDNPHKGLGIFSFSNYDVSLAPYYNPEYKYVIPLLIDHVLMFHIWAMPDPKNKKRSYVGQVWAALQYYESHIGDNTILAGDFNSHVQWDKERPNGNHSSVVKFLSDKAIVSTYHHTKNIDQGRELDPTIYLLKQKQRPYHLDYCFVSKSMITARTMVEVGQYHDWIKLSDHMPLIVDGLSFA